MKAVIQRVTRASVTINNKLYSSIDKGLLILIGFTNGDTEEKINKIVDKIIKLRIFEDENQKMNLNIKDINGNILSISQFTLYADTKSGNRPSFIEALNYNDAKKLYEIFNNKLKEKIVTETGVFGEDMKIELVNDGPVTIIMEE